MQQSHIQTDRESNRETTRQNVFKSLIREYNNWRDKLPEFKGKSNEGIVVEIIRWLKGEILSSFSLRDFKNLQKNPTTTNTVKNTD